MKSSTIRRSTVLIVVLIALFTAVLPVAANPPESAVAGTFVTYIFTGPDCNSPVDYCSAGTVTGDITGDVDVALQTAYVTEIDGVPTFVYSTNITITAHNGTWSGVSNGTISLVTSELNAVFELTSGTGYYTNRRAVLTVSGTSNAETGEEVLPFTGTMSVVPPGQR